MIIMPMSALDARLEPRMTERGNYELRAEVTPDQEGLMLIAALQSFTSPFATLVCRVGRRQSGEAGLARWRE